MFCAKNRTENQQIFEKWDHFENRPFSKGCNPCKGYSLCKMVRLGQKFKMPKTCEKRFYKSIRVVPRKKPLWKTPNIREFRPFGKSAILQGYSPCKGYSLCKMVNLSQKLKMPKTCEKRFYKGIRVVVRKKPLRKPKNSREMKPFWKSAIFQRL